MKRLAPHWQILIALGLATVTALVLRGLFGNAPEASSGAKLVSGVIATCGFIGDLFMSALKMIIVPLIVTAVISGITGMRGVQGFGRLGFKTLGFYLTSSLIAIMIGLVLVNLIEPGLIDGKPNATILAAFEENKASADAADLEKIEAASQREKKDFLAIFKAMFPENIVRAASDNSQLLGVIVLSFLFAIAVTQLPGSAGDNVRDFFTASNEAMITVTKWILSFSPIGVYALILPVIHEAGLDLYLQLGKYFFTVLFGLLIHFGVILPLALKFIGKISPIAHFKAMRPALLLAFSTASSAATLPVTMRSIEENAGVSKRISGFTIPLGATVNMDGTALYECVAVIFVAQVMGIELGFGSQFFIIVAALLTSIGMAGIPSASLVAILIILKNSGIPNAEVAVVTLLSVDRLLDMSRTAVNVYSDSCAAVIVARTEGEVFLYDEPRDAEIIPEDNVSDDRSSRTE
jgi:proton glutamate symport protein